ncbi:MAG: class I SAM-dependent methyltransferase [Rudaea sp.]|nr:class I SAM-dependent methyltransferase [Rudaea sp.]
MHRLEQWRNDFGVLRQMLRGMPRDMDHAARLQAFYAPQAAHYDDFRDRLLPGRAELVRRLPLPENARVIELGGGTGRNLDFFGPRLNRIESIEIVDLCPALLELTQARAQHRPQVRIIEGDATSYRPQSPVDCVYFSYALTMIPNWRDALANACKMLKPGGALGVVDFYVAPSQPASGRARHGALERVFWRRWFAHDGVRLNPEHLLTLEQMFPRHETFESRAPVPYLPGIRVPYYIFVGCKTGAG